jgi:hypothetical protein
VPSLAFSPDTFRKLDRKKDPLTASRNNDIGMNMKISQVTIYPINEDLIRADGTIVFDNCLVVEEINVMENPTVFLSPFLP